MTVWIILPIAAGVLSIAVGFRNLHRQRLLSQNGISTVGWVYRLDREHDADSTTYTPAIAFRDENNVEHKFRATVSSNRIEHPVGSEVPLRYLPGRPETAAVNTRSHRVTSLLLPFGLGVVFILVAVYVMASGVPGS